MTKNIEYYDIAKDIIGEGKPKKLSPMKPRKLLQKKRPKKSPGGGEKKRPSSGEWEIGFG
ncbi:hypothetical protein HYV49_04205 [Candidatus Pacearchaeota archaeon]|nr:hypothetical protein [Candidatus Pacearchaeota archaeon]